MIDHLEGIISAKLSDSLVIDMNGLGFLVETAPSINSKLPSVGENVRIFTTMHVRETEIALFGFASVEERTLFLLLQTVSGIGPRAALQILDAMDPGSFALAVLQGDTKTLTKAKGIGKKTAERLIVELKDKVSKETLPLSNRSPHLERPSTVSDDIYSEVISALVVLGYPAGEAEAVLSRVDVEPDDTVETLLRRVLTQLASW